MAILSMCRCLRSRLARWRPRFFDLGVALLEHGAAEFVEPTLGSRRRFLDERGELAFEGVETRTRKGRARPLEMRPGEARGDPLHLGWGLAVQGFGEEHVQVARRAHSPANHFASAAKRADPPALVRRDGTAEQGERRAQAAQRDPRLVDADRPAARQHDGAIFPRSAWQSAAISRNARSGGVSGASVGMQGGTYPARPGRQPQTAAIR
jgi:hypothetical protein